jgi:acetylglutamate kinase
MAQSIGLVPEMIDGRHITDAMLEVVVMIYAGQINKDIVAQLQANKTNAMGFSGADGNLIQSNKEIIQPLITDMWVMFKNSSLLQNSLIRVYSCFCAITHDKQGQLLNTNADTIASELAIALSKSMM